MHKSLCFLFLLSPISNTYLFAAEQSACISFLEQAQFLSYYDAKNRFCALSEENQKALCHRAKLVKKYVEKIPELHKTRQQEILDTENEFYIKDKENITKACQNWLSQESSFSCEKKKDNEEALLLNLERSILEYKNHKHKTSEKIRILGSNNGYFLCFLSQCQQSIKEHCQKNKSLKKKQYDMLPKILKLHRDAYIPAHQLTFFNTLPAKVQYKLIGGTGYWQDDYWAIRIEYRKRSTFFSTLIVPAKHLAIPGFMLLFKSVIPTMYTTTMLAICLIRYVMSDDTFAWKSLVLSGHDDEPITEKISHYLNNPDIEIRDF